MINDDVSKFAILIGAPHKGQLSMHNDVSVMYDCLQQRGFKSDQIISLEGTLTRQLVLDFFVDIKLLFRLSNR